MSTNKEITLRINGKDEAAKVPPHRTLLETLRGLGHVDVKCGCEKGDCGACAVLIDGRWHQTGRPLDVLRRPADAAVARFLGARTVMRSVRLLTQRFAEGSVTTDAKRTVRAAAAGGPLGETGSATWMIQVRDAGGPTFPVGSVPLT